MSYEENYSQPAPVQEIRYVEAPAPQQTTRERAADLSLNALPQDHQGAKDRIVTIIYKGKSFELDCAKWTFKVQRIFERNLAMEGLRMLFGDQQLETMDDWDFVEDFPAFMKEVQKARAAGK